MSQDFGHALLNEWLFQKDLTFLNHGAYGAVPRPVLSAQHSWREELERQPVNFINNRLEAMLHDAAKDLATFVGASPDALVFVSNSTEGANAAIKSVEIGPGDVVVTTDQAYQGVVNALLKLCRSTGARLNIAKLPWPVFSADQIVDAVEATLGPRVRLVVLDHVSSKGAILMPIERLVGCCRKIGIPVLVDGAHALGMTAVNTESVKADWYVGSCHKWFCAPKGCAFLTVSEEQKLKTHPTVTSTGYQKGFWKEFSWIGIRDPSPWLAVTAALKFWKDLGVASARSYMNKLADWAGDELVNKWGTERVASTCLTGAMVTVRVPQSSRCDPFTAENFHDHLLRCHRIEVPVFTHDGELWVRVSTHVYNSEVDIELLASAIN